LRNNLYKTKNITTLIQFEYSAFEEATVPVCSFVYQNRKTGEKGGYFRLVDFRGGMEVQRRKYLEAIENPQCGYFYTATTDNFTKIPSNPVAYWVSDRILEIFSTSTLLSEIADVKQGLSTANNDEFLRLWYEVSISKIGFGFKDSVEAHQSRLKWFPLNKGGEYRRWYGNNDYVINWYDDGLELKNYKRAAIRNEGFYFRKSITWTLISSANFGVRYSPKVRFSKLQVHHCFKKGYYFIS
jgi:hypothetical protein